MQLPRWRRAIFSMTIVLLVACQSSLAAPVIPTETPTPAVPFVTPTHATTSETPVRLISLHGPASMANAELSGLAWVGDSLLILPQYPERYGAGPDGALFALDKASILAYLDGKTDAPLEPRLVPLSTGGLRQKLTGYEGFESISVSGSQIWLTIETSQIGGMVAFLIGGKVDPDLSAIDLDSTHIEAINAQASISNFSDEAITYSNGSVITFYEANGKAVNPAPVAHRFNSALSPQGVTMMASLEFRITDATQADDNGDFWVINYFFPGDTKIKPAQDPLALRYPGGPSHQSSPVVERLVQLHIDPARITLVNKPPIYLELLPDQTARNWEGLVSLDQRGFLLVTDSHPSTLFGFVAYPLK